MERKKAYELIKKFNLQDAVLKESGRNFTMTSTAVLEKIIQKNLNQPAQKSVTETTQEQPQKKSAPKDAPTITSNAFEAACLTFLAVLKDTGCLEGLLAKL